MLKHIFRPYSFCQMKGSILELGNAQKYIESQCKKHDWTSYVISKHIPSSIRKDYLTICWFYLEMQRIEDTGKSIGLNRLDFWKQTIDDIFEDRKLSEPVSVSLQHTVKNNPIPRKLLEMMIDNRRMSTEFTNMSEMANYAEKNRSTFLATILCLLRMDFRQNNELLQCIELCGRAIGISDLVRKLPYALQKYKLLLPIDIQKKYLLNPKTLWDRVEGKPKEELYDAILEVCAFSRQCLIDSSKLQDKIPEQSFRGFLHASAVEHYLEILEDNNFMIFTNAVNRPSYIELPMRIYKNSRNKKFLQNL